MLSRHILKAYSVLSNVELRARIGELELQAAKVKAAIERGDMGHVMGSHIVKGSRVTTYSNPVAVNRLRQAVEDCREVLQERNAL